MKKWWWKKIVITNRPRYVPPTWSSLGHPLQLPLAPQATSPPQPAPRRARRQEVVDGDSPDEEDEPDQLKDDRAEDEGLPADRHRHDPDDDGAAAVEHHPRCGAQLLRDADAREVEERDADDVACSRTTAGTWRARLPRLGVGHHHRRPP